MNIRLVIYVMGKGCCTTMNNEDLAILDYVEKNPGAVGYLIGLYHESFWDKFHTGVILRVLTEEGFLRREEADKRHFKYWRTDKAV